MSLFKPDSLSMVFTYLSRKLALFMVLTCGFGQGCATRAVSSGVAGSGTAESEPSSQRRYFGFVSLAPTTREDSQVDIERVTGFGLRVAGGLSIGYFDDWVAHVKPGCQFVLMIPDGSSPAEWQTNLQANLKESLCVISKP